MRPRFDNKPADEQENAKEKQNSDKYENFLNDLSYVLNLPHVEIQESLESFDPEERDMERAIALSLGYQIPEERQNHEASREAFFADLIKNQKPLTSTQGTMFSSPSDNPVSSLPDNSAPQAAEDDGKISCKPSDIRKNS